MKLGLLLLLCATALLVPVRADDASPDAVRPPVESPDAGSTVTLLGIAVLSFALLRGRIAPAQ